MMLGEAVTGSRLAFVKLFYSIHTLKTYTSLSDIRENTGVQQLVNCSLSKFECASISAVCYSLYLRASR
jgi:hypothetical protein